MPNAAAERERKSEEREGGKEKKIKKGRVERGIHVPASWREPGRKILKRSTVARCLFTR